MRRCLTEKASILRFASSITDANAAQEAVEELLDPLDRRVTPGMVDLALLFSTAHFEDDLPDVLERVGAALPSAVVAGCTAEGTLGCDREVERLPSMSLLAASLPEVTVRPFHLTQAQLEGTKGQFAWERVVGASPESKPVFLAFADPFLFDIHTFVEQLNGAFPGAPLLGGVASAGLEPRQNRLILNGDIHREGVVGVTLTGRLDVQTVVSQGCRPIGQTLVITKGDRNVIYELGGLKVIEQLHNVLTSLPDDERRLAGESLFLGRVIDEHGAPSKRGNFLIHNIIGVDKRSGAIGITGHARTGATVQFHVRDADSADEDLRIMLAPHRGIEFAGAAMFGCNGRGTRMWSTAGHDVSVVRETLGDLPLAGFFCGGELGPIGGRNFIHAFTASIALFRDPPDGPGPAQDSWRATARYSSSSSPSSSSSSPSSSSDSSS